MLLILEGLEGTGKSTLARAVARCTNAPIYRPFRTDEHEHMGDGSRVEKMLGELGVAVNTYVEDVYAADLLGALRSDAILDRSMPSGLAYSLVQGLIPPDRVKELMEWWCWRLGPRADVLYVYMRCDPAVAAVRGRGARVRHTPDHLESLTTTLDFCYQEVSKRFRALDVDTSAAKPETVAARIMKEIKK